MRECGLHMVMCSHQRTMITAKAVMDSLPEGVGAGPLAVLSRFRREFHACPPLARTLRCHWMADSHGSALARPFVLCAFAFLDLECPAPAEQRFQPMPYKSTLLRHRSNWTTSPYASCLPPGPTTCASRSPFGTTVSRPITSPRDIGAQIDTCGAELTVSGQAEAGAHNGGYLRTGR